MSPCSTLPPPSPAGWGGEPVCLRLPDPGIPRVQPQPRADCHPEDHFFPSEVVVPLPQGRGGHWEPGPRETLGFSACRLSRCCSVCSAAMAMTEGGAEHTLLHRLMLTPSRLTNPVTGGYWERRQAHLCPWGARHRELTEAPCALDGKGWDGNTESLGEQGGGQGRAGAEGQGWENLVASEALGKAGG